ncbi:hypothetical protein ACX0MV_02090 [Pseudomonas borbori]
MKLRVEHWLFLALVAVLFFSMGAWLQRSAGPAAPLPWWPQWQSEVLTPLAEDRLSLVRLSDVLDGELWLQPRLEGPRLLYRGEWQADEGNWALEAELVMSQAERESLMQALGLVSTDGEQPLGEELLAQIGRYGVASVMIRPLSEDIEAQRLASSIGPPRLRLELPEGQAWVYPERGLTAHLEGDFLRLLHLVPREALKR